MSRPCRTRGEDGSGDARRGGQANRDLAPRRLRTWLRRRHRTGVRHLGPDRLFRTLPLCAEAKDGQILISSRVARAVEAVAQVEDLGNLELKGLRRPVAAFNVPEPIGGALADNRPEDR